MNRFHLTTLALAVASLSAMSAAATADESPMLLAQVSTGTISQSQSGGEGNKQSISIGKTDAAPKKGKKISSAQQDPETGNRQSGSVSGSAKLNQSQGGRDNTQTADVSGSAKVQQSQGGRGNSQSISIGSGVTSNSGGSPKITQSQTGANNKESVKVDGKKVE
jgi:hypothetical protein